LTQTNTDLSKDFSTCVEGNQFAQNKNKVELSQFKKRFKFQMQILMALHVLQCTNIKNLSKVSLKTISLYFQICIKWT